MVSTSLHLQTCLCRWVTKSELLVLRMPLTVWQSAWATPAKLNAPNIATIFVGIFLGLIFGSLPFAIPGMPVPVKLGLAGGPLIIAILIGRYGYKIHLVTYTTTSANMMLREIGLVLFLASVGIKAGAGFFEQDSSKQWLMETVCSMC